MSETQDEVSVQEVLGRVSELWKYLLGKWKIIVLAGLLGGGIGLTLSFLFKPTYRSVLVFVLDEENEGGSSGLASLASNFGLGGMSGSGGIFNTANLLEFLRTRSLVEKTLLKPVNDPKHKNTSYAELYIKSNELRAKWDDPKLKKIKFSPSDDRSKFTVQKDSILGEIYKKIVTDELSVTQPNEDNSILKIEVNTRSEVFSKNFSEELINIASAYYKETKTKKAKMNVDILQKQVDSVRIELFNALSGAAAANDQIFGLNPAMNVQRVPSAKKQVDVQANSAVLSELVKNLEISKMNLLNQTPLIEVIDKPIYPLEIVKLGKIKGTALGGIIAGFLIVCFLIAKRFLKNALKPKNT